MIALWVSGMAYAAAPSNLWLDVPFVKQESNGCGAAAIAMVMQYWQRVQGRPADPDSDSVRIQQVLYSRQAHGIYASDMEAFFRQHGYRTFTFAGEWQDLDQHVRKGRPLIVALKPGVGLPLHYVVVTGLDQSDQLVLLNDPATRKLLKQDRSRFERDWKAAAHWTLLAVPDSSPR